MENQLIVLNNALDGLCIINLKDSKFHDPILNPQIEGEQAKVILGEFGNAKFIKTSSVTEKAETNNFFFYKFEEDLDDHIIWVEAKGSSSFVQ